jgi:hypothetical protein
MFAFGEELYAIFAVFLALTLILLQNLWITQQVSSKAIDARLALVADNTADLIAKKYVGPDGNLDVERLSNLPLSPTMQITLGATTYGATPPSNASIYVSKRLVFVNSVPESLVVKVWR